MEKRGGHGLTDLTRKRFNRDKKGSLSMTIWWLEKKLLFLKQVEQMEGLFNVRERNIN